MEDREIFGKGDYHAMTVEKHPSKNFGELFWRPVLLYPDKVVIEQGDVSLTYAELESRTQQLAAALSRLGIGRDDKVCC